MTLSQRHEQRCVATMSRRRRQSACNARPPRHCDSRSCKLTVDVGVTGVWRGLLSRSWCAVSFDSGCVSQAGTPHMAMLRTTNDSSKLPKAVLRVVTTQRSLAHSGSEPVGSISARTTTQRPTAHTSRLPDCSQIPDRARLMPLPALNLFSHSQCSRGRLQQVALVSNAGVE